MLHPKVDAGWHLHELTKDHDLAAFVLFSSAVGDTRRPRPGQLRRRQRVLDALPDTAARWGCPPSRSTGVSGASTNDRSASLREADRARMTRGGIKAPSDEEGLALFDAALAVGAPVVLPVRLDLAAFRGEVPPLLRDQVFRRARRTAIASGGDASSWTRRLLARPPDARRRIVLDAVAAETAAVLGHTSVSSFSPDRAFKDIGFDSLASVELRNRIAGFTGLRLPATVVFDYPSPASLAEYVLGGVVSASSSTPAVPAVVTADTSGDPVAIVGMACRFPGGVDSPAALWALVRRAGRRRVPDGPRLEPGRAVRSRPGRVGKTYARRRRLPARRGRVRRRVLRHLPREATAMDPQQRLLLEPRGRRSSRRYRPAALRGRRPACSSASCTTTTALGCARLRGPEGHLLTGRGPASPRAGSPTVRP